MNFHSNPEVQSIAIAEFTKWLVEQSEELNRRLQDARDMLNSSIRRTSESPINQSFRLSKVFAEQELDRISRAYLPELKILHYNIEAMKALQEAGATTVRADMNKLTRLYDYIINGANQGEQ